MDHIEQHASVMNSRHLESGFSKSHSRSLQFHPVSTWSQSVSSLSQSCCLALNSRIKHKRNKHEQLLHTQVSCQQSDLDIQYYKWSEDSDSGDCLHNLFKGVGVKGEAIWELIRGWDILVHLSSPSWAYL